MLFLAKLLPIFVLPLGWVVALLLFGLLGRRWGPVLAALVVLYLASLPYTGSRLIRVLETRYPQLALDQVSKADAIVPLGGILGPPRPPGCSACVVNLGEANERLEAGIDLWREHKAPYLVFTGGRIPWARDAQPEGEMLAQLALARGVPRDRILLTGEVGNTDDEAHAVAGLMRARGLTRIILVTSAWHMPRAARLFRRAGVSFIPFPVDYQVDPDAVLTILDFLPRADGLSKTEQALRELYGMAYYGLVRR
jgi:uncharacterized SAM-binding protein YcdF (DUF218 family)